MVIYSQAARFEFPADINLCQDELLGGYAADNAGSADGENVEETTIDDIFE